jgi:hypothetical protein
VGRVSRNTVITILAIIGGLVALGWLIKLSVKLLGVLIGIGLVILVLAFVNRMREGRR